MEALAPRPGGETQREEVVIMVVGFVLMALFWLAAFYATAWAHRWWGRRVPLSTKDHENDRYWLTRHYIASAMAIMVSCMVLPVVWILKDAPDATRFGHTDKLAFCKKDDLDDKVLVFGGVMNAFAGMMFTGYTMADFIIMFAHGYDTADYIVHHVFFIAAGLAIRGNCILPYNSAMLMSMEVSTPFLNELLLHRHRGPSYSTRLTIAGVLFVLFFVFVRIALNTYGAVYLVLNRHFLLEIVSPWQGWFVIVSILGGTVVQYFWLPQVLKAFSANLLPRFRTRDQELLNPTGVHDVA